MIGNPYQSPLPDDFKDEQSLQYEAAIETHEKLINSLRDRVRELEGENERLKWQLVSLPVAEVLGYHMESADID